LRPERQPYPDLARALRDGEREQSVDSDARQQQREDSKRAEYAKLRRSRRRLAANDVAQHLHM
jgi:hypothetical protein